MSLHKKNYYENSAHEPWAAEKNELACRPSIVLHIKNVCFKYQDERTESSFSGQTKRYRMKCEKSLYFDIITGSFSKWLLLLLKQWTLAFSTRVNWQIRNWKQHMRIIAIKLELEYFLPFHTWIVIIILDSFVRRQYHWFDSKQNHALVRTIPLWEKCLSDTSINCSRLQTIFKRFPITFTSFSEGGSSF